jgi:hypothetical protein
VAGAAEAADATFPAFRRGLADHRLLDDAHRPCRASGVEQTLPQARTGRPPKVTEADQDRPRGAPDGPPRFGPNVLGPPSC